MTRIEEASRYLFAVSEAVKKRPLSELPLSLKEIARNLESLARTAEFDLAKVPEVDDF